MNAPLDVEAHCEDILRRAARVGYKLAELCREARVKRSTFYRWHRLGNPRLRDWKAALTRLEACIAARERSLVHELIARHPDVVPAPANAPLEKEPAAA